MEVICLNYKNYQQTRNASWKILIDCGVDRLPVQVSDVCKCLGVRMLFYTDAGALLRNKVLERIAEQTDGLSLYIKDTPVILCNDKLPIARMRFTVAHELGHIILRHILPGQATTRNREPSPDDDQEETAANQFAARLLAPACVLWGVGARSPDEIAALCGISHQAATYRAIRMAELYRRNKFLSHPMERAVFAQFQPIIDRCAMNRPEEAPRRL